jgi:hypothetical protein
VNVAGVTDCIGNKVMLAWLGILAFRYEVDSHVLIPRDGKIMSVRQKKIVCSWQRINSFSLIRGLLESVKEMYK